MGRPLARVARCDELLQKARLAANGHVVDYREWPLFEDEPPFLRGSDLPHFQAASCRNQINPCKAHPAADYRLSNEPEDWVWLRVNSRL